MDVIEGPIRPVYKLLLFTTQQYISTPATDVKMPPAKKRRTSYTAALKLEVVEYAKENGNCAAERKFGISEKLARDWRKKEDALRIIKKMKRALRGKKPRWGALEADLEA